MCEKIQVLMWMLNRDFMNISIWQQVKLRMLKGWGPCKDVGLWRFLVEMGDRYYFYRYRYQYQARRDSWAIQYMSKVNVMIGSLLVRSQTSNIECYIRSRVALKQRLQLHIQSNEYPKMLRKAYNAKLTESYKILNKCDSSKNKNFTLYRHQ